MRTGVAILIVALAVAASGCGGGDKSSEPPGSTSAKDPGRDVVGALVDAAAAGDSKAVWALLSRPSKRRLGPTEAAFARSKELRALRRQLAPFRDGKLPVQISENVDDLFGIVALSRGSNAWAAPIRHEGDLWRVELGGPLRIDVSGPPPNSRGKFLKQIGIETHGPSGAGVGLLYLDGVTLDSKSFEGPRSATLYANFESQLTPGVHTAVAFAVANTNAAARAWTFRP